MIESLKQHNYSDTSSAGSQIVFDSYGDAVLPMTLNNVLRVPNSTTYALSVVGRWEPNATFLTTPIAVRMFGKVTPYPYS